MKRPSTLCKCLSFLTAAAMSMTLLGTVPERTQTVRAADADSRIRVDINRNDGRKASYTKTANNWLVDNSYSYTVNGVTCKLSGGG